ncbi:MAG: DUF6112 family protein, partial [Acidimicrobiales bacterium]
MVPVLAQVNVEPDASALPGGAQLQQIVNGVAAFSLVVLVGAVIAGAVMWAYGSATSTYNNINGGKRMVLISALGAIIVGGAGRPHQLLHRHGGPDLMAAPRRRVAPVVIGVVLTVVVLAVVAVGRGHDGPR